jgi:hypothetical protein
VFDDQLSNAVKLGRREPFIETEHNRFQPEFARDAFASNMNMLRLIAVEAVEKQPVRARHISNRWHDALLCLACNPEMSVQARKIIAHARRGCQSEKIRQPESIWRERIAGVVRGQRPVDAVGEAVVGAGISHSC